MAFHVRDWGFCWPLCWVWEGAPCSSGEPSVILFSQKTSSLQWALAGRVLSNTSTNTVWLSFQQSQVSFCFPTLWRQALGCSQHAYSVEVPRALPSGSHWANKSMCQFKVLIKVVTWDRMLFLPSLYLILASLPSWSLAYTSCGSRWPRRHGDVFALTDSGTSLQGSL